MRFIAALAVLGACASVDEDTTAGVPNELLVTEAAPPPSFSLDVARPYVFPGNPVSMSASGLPRPGVRISFAGSRATGGAPFCPAAFGSCFELFAPGGSLGTLSTGPGGSTSTLSRVVPAAFAPGPIFLQAGLVAGGNTFLSDIETVMVVLPGGDEDGDGLGNATEDALGTDLFDADSDDGGESDGAEFANGRNPLNPNDDVVVGCYTSFEAAYLAFGDRADPTLFYGAYGLVFIEATGYGLISGDQYGDVGNWSDGTTVTTPAWGSHDFGSDVNAISFQGVTSGVSFDLIRAEGGTTVTVQVEGFRAGALVSSAQVTTSTRTGVSVPGAIDLLTLTIVGGDGFAYAVDDLRWASVPGFTCP